MVWCADTSDSLQPPVKISRDEGNTRGVTVCIPELGKIRDDSFSVHECEFKFKLNWNERNNYLLNCISKKCKALLPPRSKTNTNIN